MKPKTQFSHSSDSCDTQTRRTIAGRIALAATALSALSPLAAGGCSASNGDVGVANVSRLESPLGCYRDSWNRDLPYLAYSGQNNTIETCRAACSTAGYRYAAAQYGSQCYCGNSFGGQGSATNCDVACSGNAAESCGGSWANSVYTATTQAALGCFRDSPNRDLPHFAYSNDGNTTAACVSACKGAGYKYAGVQYGKECFCGDSYGGLGTSTDCNVMCAGDAKEMCGGAWANDVYSTGAATAPPPADAGSLTPDSGSTPPPSGDAGGRTADSGSTPPSGDAGALTADSGSTPPPPPANGVQWLLDDLTKCPDAALHGTEGLDWGNGGSCPAAPMHVNCPAKNYKGQWFTAMTNWGQAYIARDGSPAVNTRVQIRNVKTYMLRKSNRWDLVQSSSPSGAAFVENFANNAAISANARDESSNGGGVSVIVGTGAFAGHNYHFWSAGGRAPVDVNDLVAIVTTCEARLIVDDPSKADDRGVAKIVLQMGADWWLDMNTGWLPDWSANSGINGSRSKWVTKDWQSYGMSTLTPNELRATPPPL